MRTISQEGFVTFGLLGLPRSFQHDLLHGIGQRTLAQVDGGEVWDFATTLAMAQWLRSAVVTGVSVVGYYVIDRIGLPGTWNILMLTLALWLPCFMLVLWVGGRFARAFGRATGVVVMVLRASPLLALAAMAPLAWLVVATGP